MVTQTARRVDGWASSIPLHPWFFAAFPVIRLYAENLADVDPAEVVVPLVLVLLAASASMALLTLILRDARRAAIIVSAVLVPALSFGLINEVLSSTLGGGRIVLLAASVIGVGLAVILALRIREQLGALTAALNVVAAVMLALVAVPAVSGVVDAVGTADERTLSELAPVAAAGARPGRDIYHIVLDRYGSERSLQTGYGIDNSGFMDWLREQGFQVLEDSHANYARTLLSLGATMGMAPLDDIAEAAGPTSRDMRPVVRRIKESRAGAFLQAQGYEYVHLGSWFDRTGDSRTADRVFRPVDAVTFASTLEELTILPSLLGRSTDADTKAAHAAAARAQFEILEDLRDDPGPKYVFAHVLLPHPPYVFLEDGTFAPKDATLASQLAFTNERLRAFVEPLLALPEGERPIIILQADEGPYPKGWREELDTFDWMTAPVEDLVTKFGILNAWYVPGPEGDPGIRGDLSAVNTYPELFRRYFDAVVDDAPDRIYGSVVDTPFEMTDVTDRIMAAERSALPIESPSSS
jgi:hypothetical protein